MAGRVRSVASSRPGRSPDPMTATTPSTRAASALPAHDLADLGLAAEGVRRIEWAEREMPVLRLIRRAFRAREAAGGAAPGSLPARDHRDGEPGTDAEGGRCRGRAVRLEPAFHPGRRGGRARRQLRHLGVCPPRRRPRSLLQAPQSRRRSASSHDDGRRLRPRDADPPGAARPAVRDPGRDRGDDDRRDPAAGHGRGRRSRAIRSWP